MEGGPRAPWETVGAGAALLRGWHQGGQCHQPRPSSLPFWVMPTGAPGTFMPPQRFSSEPHPGFSLTPPLLFSLQRAPGGSSHRKEAVLLCPRVTQPLAAEPAVLPVCAARGPRHSLLPSWVDWKEPPPPSPRSLLLLEGPGHGGHHGAPSCVGTCELANGAQRFYSEMGQNESLLGERKGHESKGKSGGGGSSSLSTPRPPDCPGRWGHRQAPTPAPWPVSIWMVSTRSAQLPGGPPLKRPPLPTKSRALASYPLQTAAPRASARCRAPSPSPRGPQGAGGARLSRLPTCLEGWLSRAVLRRVSSAP
nr:LOW QUALITY PROTEIN: uncharacterized protein C9orf139 homolog [Aotus nancymaae]